MWLLVVAAGSGYLARCLQNASKAKRPRLDEQEIDSRSPPQEFSEKHLLSEEALQVKDRFERLEEQQSFIENDSLSDEKGLRKRSCCESSSDALEGRLVSLTSFQKGIHDLRSPSNVKCRMWGWPSWPKGQKNNQNTADDQRMEVCESSKLPGHNEIEEVSDVESDTGSAFFEISSTQRDEKTECVPMDVNNEEEANITVKTPLGDVSWRTSRQDAERISLESLGDLPNIFDWTSMAASQKHLMFGVDGSTEASLITPKNRKHSDRKSRGSRGRSKDSSVPSTPNVSSLRASATSLPTLPKPLRKRKAANGILNAYADSGYLAKEVLLFAMGLHIGVSCMLFYHKSEMDKLNRLLKQPSFRRKNDTLKAIASNDLNQPDDDRDSITSVLTVETKPDQMAVLEAELEAELEIMQLNLKVDHQGKREIQSSDMLSSVGSLHEDCVRKHENDSSPPDVQTWAVSPRELDRRLHILLEERQEQEIKELQAELREAERKLQLKEEELRSWKDRVFQMTETSPTSPTEDNGAGKTTKFESPLTERPVRRKKWFSEDFEDSAGETGPSRWHSPGRTINSSRPSLVSAMSSCRLSEKDDGDTGYIDAVVDGLDRLSISRPKWSAQSIPEEQIVVRAGPVSRSSVSVSDLLQRVNKCAGGNEENGGIHNQQTTWKPGHYASERRCSRACSRRSTSSTSSYDDVKTRRSSLGATANSRCAGFLPATSDARLQDEHLVYVNSNPLWSEGTRTKLAYGCQQSQVIRTVERIEERHYHCQDGHDVEERWASKKMMKPRHSTGNMLSSRHRSQRPRRRWFS